VVDLKEGHRGSESNEGEEMKRGDKVKIRSGAWIEHTGTVVWVDHSANDLTIALDEGPTHMVKTSMNNIERLPCNLTLSVV
jgi:transcription antitermination factor NusG